MSSFGTYHLADNPTLYEPARSNNFEFVVTDIDDLIYAGTDKNTASDKDHITNGQEVLRVSVVSSSVPHFSLGKIEVKRGNNTIKFAGTPSFDDGKLVLNDYMGARTKDILLAWQALAYDVITEKVHRATNYKKDCTLVEYSPDYDEVLRTWTLQGCWISELSEDDFSNEDNDKRTVSVTVVYDKAIPHKSDVE